MKRKFSFSKLPDEIKSKIYEFNFVDESDMFDEDVLCEVWLKDGWLFDGESHYATFGSREQLIECFKNYVVKEYIKYFKSEDDAIKYAKNNKMNIVDCYEEHGSYKASFTK